MLSSALEMRFFAELASLTWLWPLLATAPRGDGHPVLLLPGFMGSEASLIGLELFLRNRGYAVRPGGWAATWASTPNTRRRWSRRSATCTTVRAQGQPGGLEPGRCVRLYGAHQVPECVRSVITLGSPVSVDPRAAPRRRWSRPCTG
jgi:hypothetical protein